MEYLLMLGGMSRSLWAEARSLLDQAVYRLFESPLLMLLVALALAAFVIWLMRK